MGLLGGRHDTGSVWLARSAVVADFECNAAILQHIGEATKAPLFGVE